MENEKKSRRWLSTLVFGVGALFVSLLLIFLIVNLTTSSKLNSTLKQAQGQGFLSSPKEVIVVCADDENAALPLEEARQNFSMKNQAAATALDNAYRYWGSLKPEDKDALRKALAENEKSLNLIREAVSRPYYTFQPDYSRPMQHWKISASYGFESDVHGINFCARSAGAA